jgi:hypothetical protein
MGAMAVSTITDTRPESARRRFAICTGATSSGPAIPSTHVPRRRRPEPERGAINRHGETGTEPHSGPGQAAPGSHEAGPAGFATPAGRSLDGLVLVDAWSRGARRDTHPDHRAAPMGHRRVLALLPDRHARPVRTVVASHGPHRGIWPSRRVCLADHASARHPSSSRRASLIGPSTPLRRETLRNLHLGSSRRRSGRLAVPLAGLGRSGWTCPDPRRQRLLEGRTPVRSWRPPQSSEVTVCRGRADGRRLA